MEELGPLNIECGNISKGGATRYQMQRITIMEGGESKFVIDGIILFKTSLEIWD